MLKIGKIIKARITITDWMLGTAPKDKEIYGTWVASKNPDKTPETIAEEVATIKTDDVTKNTPTMTCFPRDLEGRPFVFAYQFKGFLKAACGALARIPGTESSDLKARMKVITGTVKVGPKWSPITVGKLPEFDPNNISYPPKDAPVGTLATCQRPLRVNDASGERTCLAISEAVPPGSTFDFEIQLLNPKLEDLIRELLDYGDFGPGLLQWRNSGKGAFTWEELV